MNRILKIVGGPLKGAEIALVAGTKVKVGSGDGCDVLVSDPTLGAVAFELEVTEEDVTVTLPDGTAKTMLDFEAREFGSSAFAVGPAEGVWQEIVWPERRTRGPELGDQGVAKPVDEPSAAKPEPEAAKAEAEDGKTASRASCLVPLVVFLLLIAVLVWLAWRYRDRAAEIWYGWFPDREAEVAKTEAERPTLEEIAVRYALKVAEADGRTVVTGDFKTRGERLRAAAEVYSVRPGADLDFVDDESLFSGASDLLKLVTEGRVEVLSATNRVVALKGYAASTEALREILVALDADVHGVARVDCTGVTCGSNAEAVEELPTFPPVPGEKPRPRRAKSAVSPNLPVCGILTTPYRCLILKDGSRILEGGEFGGCIVERISADAVMLRNAAGAFEWRP